MILCSDTAQALPGIPSPRVLSLFAVSAHLSDKGHGCWFADSVEMRTAV